MAHEGDPVRKPEEAPSIIDEEAVSIHLKQLAGVVHALEPIPAEQPTNNLEVKRTVHARILELEKALPVLENGGSRGSYTNYEHLRELIDLHKKLGEEELYGSPNG